MKEKYMIGLSGGINSMAVLCWLIEQPDRPKEIHLYYAHFAQHSPDTFQFVADGIRYARKHFDNVIVKITSNNVLHFFEKEHTIPHPKLSPCSRILKIEPMAAYAFDNAITIDLIGYVKHELKRRTEGQQKNIIPAMFEAVKHYPIGAFTDDWCFEIVTKHLGWYPAIYDIVDEKGKRVFKHNNCLPCKNMYVDDMKAVKKYFPEYHLQAMKLSAILAKYWGREEAKFYAEFGRELGQDITCSTCKF